jgi:hypothetical protein
MSRWGGLWERFDANVEKRNGCWLWQGSITDMGYGSIFGQGRRRYAHRLMWERTFGPIPVGQCVLHHCDNPRCVNPSHLFLGTKADNTRDMWSKGRQGGSPARNAVKHLCDCHGFPLNAERRCAFGYQRFAS